jgi:neurexin
VLLVYQVDGNVVAMYNMGLSDHVVRVLTKRFNDGLYHIVRYWRNGANSTLQVDDLPAAHTQPTGARCNNLWLQLLHA